MNVNSINNIPQTLDISVDLKVKQSKEKLIEKILEAMRQKIATLPEQEKIVYISNTQAKLEALTAGVSPEKTVALTPFVNFLNDQLTTVKATITTSQVRGKKMTRAVAVQSEMVVQPKPTLKVSNPSDNGSVGDYFPVPTLPPSGFPQPPTTNGPAWQGNDDLTWFEKILTHIGNLNAEPGAMNALMAKIFSGTLTPDEAKLLDAADLCGETTSELDGGIAMWANQMADLAATLGFTPKGSTQPEYGADARTAYLTEMDQQLKPLLGRDKFIGCMKLNIDNLLQGSVQWKKDHTAANGNLIWTDPATGLPLDWTTGDDSKYGQQMQILSIIEAQSGPSIQGVMAPNPFLANFDLNSVQRTYRLSEIDKMSDNVNLLMVWYLTICDSDSEGTMSGYNKQTDTLTDGTHYANEMTDAIGAFSSSTTPGTADDAAKFEDALFGGESYMMNHPAMSSISGQYTLSVYTEAYNAQVPNSAPSGSSTNARLGDVLKECMQTGSYNGKPAEYWLNSLLNPSSATPSTDPNAPAAAPNSETQVFNNIANTGANMMSGQSKTVQVEMGTISNTLTAASQTASKFEQTLLSMMSQMVKQQTVAS